MRIDLTNININELVPGCRHFYWREFLWLNTWKTHAHPPLDVAGHIVRIAHKLEWIRAELGAYPITITSGYRPSLYNKVIGGAEKSRHMVGDAADFVHGLYTPDQVRERLEPKLEELNIRMEKLPGSSWVHVDNGPVIKNRYFTP